MISRAIVLYPKFNNLEYIDEIREKYDPLYKFIAPHLTLVFPFKSELTTAELVEHLTRNLKETVPFELVAKGITGASGGYVFLDVKVGNDNVIDLHDKLYSGILKSHHNRFIPYQPHITIANIKDDSSHRNVVEELADFNIEFRARIDRVAIEIIDGTDKAMLEYEHRLYDELL